MSLRALFAKQSHSLAIKEIASGQKPPLATLAPHASAGVTHRALFAAFWIFLLWALFACDASEPLMIDQPAAARRLPGAPAVMYLVKPTYSPYETPVNLRDAANLKLPECAPSSATGLSVPTNFAPKFPFPPAMKLYKVSSLQSYNATQVVLHTPLNLTDSVGFLLDELPKAGYALGRGDSEQGEAEAQFEGNGWTGSFWVRDVLTCEGMTEWVVIVQKN